MRTSHVPLKKQDGRASNGGARNGAGRPKGVPNKKPRDWVSPAQRAAIKADKALEQAGVKMVDIFDGDAHAYLCSVYRNTKLDPAIRMDAAKACIPYEKPRLAATTVAVKRPSEMTDAQLAELAEDAESSAAAIEAAEQSGKLTRLRGPAEGGADEAPTVRRSA